MAWINDLDPISCFAIIQTEDEIPSSTVLLVTLPKPLENVVATVQPNSTCTSPAFCPARLSISDQVPLLVYMVPNGSKGQVIGEGSCRPFCTLPSLCEYNNGSCSFNCHCPDGLCSTIVLIQMPSAELTICQLEVFTEASDEVNHIV